MKIAFSNLIYKFRRKNNDTQNGVTTQPAIVSETKASTCFEPLLKDTVSFSNPIKRSYIRKADFKGIDYAIVEKYKVDINKFNSTDDLQVWAKDKIKKCYVDRNFEGRRPVTREQRKVMMQRWIDYVTKVNVAYTPVMQLAILDAVTKELKPFNDELPPELHAGVLADTMSEALEKLNKNPKDFINLNKLYNLKYREFYNKANINEVKTSSLSGWVIIPSKEHDEQHFEENVKRLKNLSHKTWCTKSMNAQPYLREGDFHVFLENGNPKVGVRFRGQEIQEIQGELNNGKIPQRYLTTVEQHLLENNYKISEKVSSEFKEAKDLSEEIKKIKDELGEDTIKKADAQKILPYFGMSVEKDEDGMFIVSEYRKPTNIYTFDDFGIDENKLVKNIKIINGNVDIKDLLVSNFENLECVKGNFDAKNHIEINMPKLKQIVGEADFSNVKQANLDNLEKISGDGVFFNSSIEKLPNLQIISGIADFRGAGVGDLTSLRQTGDLRLFANENLKSLDSLEMVLGNLSVFDSPFVSMKKLKKVYGDVFFANCKVETMPELEFVGGTLTFKNTPIKDLPLLKIIGRDLKLNNSNIEAIDNLVEIRGSAYLGNSKIKSLKKLELIRGNADFNNTEIENFESLKSVWGKMNIANSSLLKEKLKDIKIGGFVF